MDNYWDAIISALVAIAILALKELFDFRKKKKEIEKLAAERTKLTADTKAVELNITLTKEGIIVKTAQEIEEVSTHMLTDLKRIYDRRIEQLEESMRQRHAENVASWRVQKEINTRLIKDNQELKRILRQYRAGIKLLIATIEDGHLSVPWRPSPIDLDDTQPLPTIPDIE